MSRRHPRVALTKKLALSFEEAASLSGIGETQLRIAAERGSLNVFCATDGGHKYKVPRLSLEQYIQRLANSARSGQ